MLLWLALFACSFPCCLISIAYESIILKNSLYAGAVLTTLTSGVT